MSDTLLCTKEKLRIALGAVAALLATCALLNLVFSDSWLEAGASLVLALLALVALLLAVGKPRLRRPGASTNTQQQNPPPAILRHQEDNRR